MIVGEIVQLKDKSYYVAVNKEGTLEKLPKIKWYGLLLNEIKQGFGKYMTIQEARNFINKYRKGVKNG
jgi:hypothetical protein